MSLVHTAEGRRKLKFKGSHQPCINGETEKGLCVKVKLIHDRYIFFVFMSCLVLLKHGINLKLNGLTCLPNSMVSFSFQSTSSFFFAPIYRAWSIQQKEENMTQKMVLLLIGIGLGVLAGYITFILSSIHIRQLSLFLGCTKMGLG